MADDFHALDRPVLQTAGYPPELAGIGLGTLIAQKTAQADAAPPVLSGPMLDLGMQLEFPKPEAGQTVHASLKPQTGDISKLSALDHQSVDALVKELGTRGLAIHFPKGYDPGKATPVLFAIHGAYPSDPAALMEQETQLSQKADAKNFIVVYPVSKKDGMAYEWASPQLGFSQSDSYDDLTYLQSVVAGTLNSLNIDRNLVGVTGFSEGGEVAQALALSMPGTFSSVMSDNGTLIGVEPKATVGDKTSALFVNGDHNYFIPLDGGRGSMTFYVSRLANSDPASQLKLWARVDELKNCSVATDDSVQKVTSCAPDKPGGAEVKQVVRKGSWWGVGKNAWDGGKGGGGLWWFSGIGNPDPKYDVSEEFSNFFLTHPKEK